MYFEFLEEVEMRAFTLSVAIFFLVASSVTAGKIIYVDEIAAGANDGSRWDDAYNFLQDALADANEAEKPV